MEQQHLEKAELKPDFSKSFVWSRPKERAETLDGVFSYSCIEHEAAG